MNGALDIGNTKAAAGMAGEYGHILESMSSTTNLAREINEASRRMVDMLPSLLRRLVECLPE